MFLLSWLGQLESSETVSVDLKRPLQILAY